jgi:hypothetical protein
MPNAMSQTLDRRDPNVSLPITTAQMAKIINVTAVAGYRFLTARKAAILSPGVSGVTLRCRPAKPKTEPKAIADKPTHNIVSPRLDRKGSSRARITQITVIEIMDAIRTSFPNIADSPNQEACCKHW